MRYRLIAALAILFLSTGIVPGQAPIAYNDTVTVSQFSFDTINVAAIDSSTSGDSLCLFKIYGSPNFSLVNCSNVAYHPDTTFTGWDSCHYILCYDGDTLLCDTAVLVVNVTTYYRPFMLRNSKWVGVNYGNNCLLLGVPPDYRDYNSYITADTDTSIGGLNYYALYDIRDYYEFDCFDGGPGGPFVFASHAGPFLIGYLRQDTLSKKVFMLNLDSVEIVLYDFNLAIGDTEMIMGTPQLVVTRIDYGMIGGSYGASFIFSPFHQQSNVWVEGFGSINGLLSPYNLAESGGPYLLCFSHNDTVIWPSYNPDSTCANGNIISSLRTVPANSGSNLYPNPAGNSVTITGLKPRAPIIITNLLGQVLVNEIAESNIQTLDISRLAAGMYFVNNMKLVKE